MVDARLAYRLRVLWTTTNRAPIIRAMTVPSVPYCAEGSFRQAELDLISLEIYLLELVVAGRCETDLVILAASGCVALWGVGSGDACPDLIST